LKSPRRDRAVDRRIDVAAQGDQAVREAARPGIQLAVHRVPAASAVVMAAEAVVAAE
jgi:hypothetical protein